MTSPRSGVRLAPVFALLLVASGCIAPNVQRELGVPPVEEAWRLDCALGATNASWPHPCVARASSTPGSKTEIWLAVNPTDPQNVVLGSKDNFPESSNNCVWNGLAVTLDGGASWKDVTIGGAYASRAPGSPYFGYACNTDPMFAFSKDGKLHYVVEMYNAAGPDGSGPLGPDPLSGRALLLAGWKLVLATSLDGGASWPEDQTVTLDQTEGVVGINDYSRIVVNPSTGSIVTAINTFSGGPFFLAGAAYSVCNVIVSRDQGKTAALPVRIVPKDPALKDLGCSVVAASPQGTLVLGASNGGSSMWATSTDDGRTWSDWAPGFTFKPIAGTFNGSEFRTGTNFEARYDLATGRLFVLYADSTRDEADVHLRASEDDGKTWGEPVRVNQDEPGAHQFMGNFAIAGDGSLHAFFMDTRHDEANRLVDITHAVSGDGGATWADRRVTNMSWDADLGVHQEGFPFIGDYIGVDAVGDHVWGGFPDTTTGEAVIAAARVMRD